MAYGFRKSIVGRYLGLDNSYRLFSRSGFRGADIYLGTAGSETKSDIQDFSTVTAVTSANTGSTISARGITTLGTTSGSSATFTLSTPITGVRKTVVATGVSTSQTLAMPTTSIGIQTTGAGATGSTNVTFVARGQALSLVALSTALWGITGSHASPTYST